MNAARLLEYFDRIAEAPDAVSRLRKFILDLAVRGKLVEQDPNDEPASELLKKIGLKHAQGAFEDGFSRYLLPVGWIWSTLQMLSDKIHYGFTASADKSCKEIRLLRISDIQSNSVDWAAVPGCVIDEKEIEQYKLESGDILIARTGGTIGKTFLVESIPVVSVFASYLIRVKTSKKLFDKYVKFFLESPVYWSQLYDGARGAGQPNVNGQTLGKLAVPLPPLAEQHRIVAKVDELMALCDRLEASQAKRESRRDRLASASLKRIGQPEDVGNGEEFRENVRFHLHHLPRLATRPEHVKELRQTILNLAVRGKLVPQDPNDEPASELLERLVKSLADKMCGSRLRRSEMAKISRPNFFEQVKFPDAWTLTSFDEVSILASGVAKGKNLKGYQTISLPYLRVANVQRGYLDLRIIKEIEIRTDEVARYALEENDVLMTEGGDWDKLGRAAIWHGEIKNCIHQNHIFRIRSVDFSQLSPDWMVLFANSPLGRSYFENASKQTTNLASINMGQLRSCPLPLPPFAEQHRIVAKVDELMNLCNQLEIQLVANQTNQSRLLEATLCDAVGVTCLPVSRPSRPAPSLKRVVAAHSEQPPKPITPRPNPVEPPMAAVQGRLIEQPTSQVEKPRAANGDIPGAILAHMQPGQEYSRAQLAEALGLSVYEWNMAIRELKESGRVVQTGERRGARYWR